MENLKLLIADDEENIRSGLKHIIDWESCGYRLCGEASNGKDAVSQIIDLRPDLVIIDVKMPGASGIEVIRQIYEFYDSQSLIRPVFIILSGFSEFEYAKEAVSLGARAYLVKPIDEDELEDLVKKVSVEIKKSYNLANELKKANELKAHEFFMNVIRSQNTEVPQELANLKILENCAESTYISLIFCENYFESKNPLSDLKEIIQNSLAFFTYLTLEIDYQFIVILKTTNDEAVKNCLNRIASKLNSQTVICKGQPCLGIKGFLDSYNQAQSLVKYLFYFSGESYITVESLSKIKKDASQNSDSNKAFLNLSDSVKKIVFCIETYDKVMLEKIILQLRDEFYYASDEESITKKNMINFLLELRNSLIAKYPEREISDGQTKDVLPIILEKKSFDECFEFFKSVINDFIEKFNFNTADSVIVKVIAYVKNNYNNELKLEELGQLFNCNSAYLGKKFKKYTGCQFNTYLDMLRIEDAKDKLVNTDLKIYQISKLVGYANNDYFYMKFKRSTGYTPKEFKSAVLNGEIEFNRK